MRLTELRLHNFRQFYGTTPPIVFASGEKKVTVVHGVNGAGKTALLNALTWVLYESFSRGFQLPDQLINKRALREAPLGEKVEAWVELSFEHRVRKYYLRRSVEAVRTSDEDWGGRTQPPLLQVSGSDGEWKRVVDVSGEIQKALPDDLHNYFFFDGERIESIVQPDGAERGKLAVATKKLLGVTPLERGVRHLDLVRKDFESGLREIGDEETKQLIQEKDEKEAQRRSLEEEVENLDRQCGAEERVKGEIQNRLRNLEKVSALQQRRDDLDRRATGLKAERAEALKLIRNEIGRHGYTSLIGDPILGFEEAIEELRKRGELPTGIKSQFVRALLDTSKCICNRDLAEGAAREAVEAWMKRAGLMDVEEQAIRMGGEVGGLRDTVESFWVHVDGAQGRREECRSELARVEEELDSISEQLDESPSEDVRRLEGRLKEADRQINEWTRIKGGKETESAAIQLAVADLEKRLERRQLGEERQKLLQRRVGVTIEARNRIMRVMELLEAELQRGLNEKIRQIFRSISVTPYTPVMDSEYRLTLMDGTAQVAASQGESQILGFTFIGAIVEAARERNRRESQIQASAAELPIVMDSPFGSLDPNHREQLCKNLGLLADQVTIMLTGTQWRGEVEEALSDAIGRTYVLTYHTPRDVEEIGRENATQMAIGGQVYDLVVRSTDEFEFTEIREVQDG